MLASYAGDVSPGDATTLLPVNPGYSIATEGRQAGKNTERVRETQGLEVVLVWFEWKTVGPDPKIIEVDSIEMHHSQSAHESPS